MPSGQDRFDLDPVAVASYLGGAIFVGVVVIVLHDARLLGILWAAAFFAVGVASGFLFGIPRTVQSDGQGTAGFEQRVNTNLEQISDWLTKILVGLGLSQLGNLPSKLQETAGYIAEGMGNTAAHRVYACGIMVYFSVVGFIGGYLLTRIFLPRLFYHAQERLQQAVAGLAAIAGGGPVGPAPIATSGGGATPANQAADAVNTTTEVLSAYSDLEKKASTDVLRAHIRNLEPSRQAYPLFRNLYIILARLYRWTGDLPKAIEILSEFILNKQKSGSGSDKDTAAGFFNRACYQSLQLGDKNAEEREVLKKKALEDLYQAISRAEEYKKEARDDPDFLALAQDADFQKVTST